MQTEWSLADRITRCVRQVQGILSIFYGGSVAPETLEMVILPCLEQLESELTAIAHTVTGGYSPIDLNDPYLRRHAARYQHPTLGSDSIWRVASYLNWLEPGQQTVPPEVRQRVVALLQQVTPQPAEPLN
jgi:hypothetical protein